MNSKLSAAMGKIEALDGLGQSLDSIDFKSGFNHESSELVLEFRFTPNEKLGVADTPYKLIELLEWMGWDIKTSTVESTDEIIMKPDRVLLGSRDYIILKVRLPA